MAMKVSTGLALLLVKPAMGHMAQLEPMSRQVSYSSMNGRNGNSFDDIETAPYAFNSGGVKRVQERAYDEISSATLNAYGGGEVFPHLPESDINGNMLEPNEIAKRHFVCGDPRLGRPDEEIKYSTPNDEWDPLTTYSSGQTIEIELYIYAFHHGHVEFFICDTADMGSGDVADQECFNKYPLTRASDDNGNSPIDPEYPGRYYPAPPCSAWETGQNLNKGVDYNKGDKYDPYTVKVRYELPKITCTHCIMQMHYYGGHKCKFKGYDEFSPTEWPFECAKEKADWVNTDGVRDSDKICGDSKSYPEEFWNCADITIESSAGLVPDSDDDNKQAGPISRNEPSTPTEELFEEAECVTDAEARIMVRFDTMVAHDKMTPEVCMSICRNASFELAGVQYGKECFCGEEGINYLVHGDDDAVCDYPCEGDSSKICGGYWSMNIYKLY